MLIKFKIMEGVISLPSKPGRGNERPAGRMRHSKSNFFDLKMQFGPKLGPQDQKKVPRGSRSKTLSTQTLYLC